MQPVPPACEDRPKWVLTCAFAYSPVPVVDLVSERCPLRGGPCHWDDVCALHPTWVRASEAVRNALTMTTLAQVAAADRDLLAGQLVE